MSKAEHSCSIGSSRKVKSSNNNNNNNKKSKRTIKIYVRREDNNCIVHKIYSSFDLVDCLTTVALHTLCVDIFFLNSVLVVVIFFFAATTAAAAAHNVFFKPNSFALPWPMPALTVFEELGPASKC